MGLFDTAPKTDRKRSELPFIPPSLPVSLLPSSLPAFDRLPPDYLIVRRSDFQCNDL